MNLRPFNPEFMLQALPVLLPFLAVTLFVGITSIIGGSLFGGLLTAAKLSRHSLLRYLARAYTYIMRCTPSIVLLFIVFYGLPRLTEALFDYEIDDFDRSFFAIVTFVLLFGAYISEVFRSAYLAVPKGQLEAAVSMGLSPLQAVQPGQKAAGEVLVTGNPDTNADVQLLERHEAHAEFIADQQQRAGRRGGVAVSRQMSMARSRWRKAVVKSPRSHATTARLL